MKSRFLPCFNKQKPLCDVYRLNDLHLPNRHQAEFISMLDAIGRTRVINFQEVWPFLSPSDEAPLDTLRMIAFRRQTQGEHTSEGAHFTAIRSGVTASCWRGHEGSLKLLKMNLVESSRH